MVLAAEEKLFIISIRVAQSLPPPVSESAVRETRREGVTSEETSKCERERQR